MTKNEISPFYFEEEENLEKEEISEIDELDDATEEMSDFEGEISE